MPELDLYAQSLVEQGRELAAQLAQLDEDTRIDVLNEIRAALHEVSPLRDQPADYVRWVPAKEVEGNAYNPNVVAPAEMRLLERSMRDNGITMGIVVWREDGSDHYEVVDGFHRHTVGKEKLAEQLRGRLPVVVVNDSRTGLADRMAATVQHNAARGKHTVDGMAELVLDLARQRKSDKWISENLGLDPDEVLRLRQTQGLAEMFADEEFSEAWEPATPAFEPDSLELPETDGLEGGEQ